MRGSDKQLLVIFFKCLNFSRFKSWPELTCVFSHSTKQSDAFESFCITSARDDLVYTTCSHTASEWSEGVYLQPWTCLDNTSSYLQLLLLFFFFILSEQIRLLAESASFNECVQCKHWIAVSRINLRGPEGLNWMCPNKSLEKQFKNGRYLNN